MPESMINTDNCKNVHSESRQIEMKNPRKQNETTLDQNKQNKKIMRILQHLVIIIVIIIITKRPQFYFIANSNG